MGGPWLIPPPVVRRHTPKSRTFGDKLQELTLRDADSARGLEKLVDFALQRLDGPPLPRRKRA